MKLTVDGEVLELDTASISNKEGMLVEKATGMLFAEWQEKLNAGSMLAQTALVWLAKRRNIDPNLPFEAVEYRTLEVDLGDEAADASDPSNEPGHDDAAADPSPSSD